MRNRIGFILVGLLSVMSLITAGLVLSVPADSTKALEITVVQPVSSQVQRCVRRTDRVDKLINHHDHSYKTMSKMWYRVCNGTDPFIEVFKIRGGYKVTEGGAACRTFTAGQHSFTGTRHRFKFLSGNRTVKVAVPCHEDKANVRTKRVSLKIYTQKFCPVQPCYPVTQYRPQITIRWQNTNDKDWTGGGRVIGAAV